MHHDAAFIALLAIAAGVALLARWLKFPYTVALVVAGLVLGATHVLQAPHLTKELLFSLFLPGLLFEAAFHMDVRKFLRNKIMILSLAVPGVALSVAMTASLLTPIAPRLHLVDFTAAGAVVFAAVISATDPIAVVALFRSLGAPKRLRVLIEAESLLNDGTSVVLFTIVLAAAMGGSTSVAHGGLHFVTVVGLGVLIGGGIGFVASQVFKRVDEPMIEITITTIAAYGSFAISEALGYSGVIATVVAGMVCGNYGAKIGMSPTTRVAVESFWEYVAFALNSIVFLLIGLEVRVADLLADWRPILTAWAVVTLSRGALIALVTLALRRSAERLPWSWAAILTWGGLRGGLSMVLALSLPAALDGRESIVTMTFGVVVISILAQGLTMPWLMRRLGATKKPSSESHDALVADRIAARAAFEALAEVESAEEAVASRLRRECQTRTELATAAVDDGDAASASRDAELHLRKRMLTAEKAAVLAAMHDGVLGADVAEDYVRELDAKLVALDDAKRERD